MNTLSKQILTILLVIILLAIGFYLADRFDIFRFSDRIDLSQRIMQNQQDGNNSTDFSLPQTPADWRSYTNLQTGISFNYPQDWQVDDTDGLIRVSNYDPSQAPGTEYNRELHGDLFKIEILEITGFSDLQNWFLTQSEQESPLTGEKPSITSSANFKIADNTALYYEIEDERGLKTGVTAIQTPRNTILYMGGLLNFPEHSEQYLQVVASLRFL